jgi:hypothetical protein
MVSGVGFKNTADEEQQKGAPRKRLVSRGLIGGFIFLVIIVAAWGGLKLWHGNLVAEVTAIDDQIKQTNVKTRQALENSDVSDFAVRAGILENELYRGHSTNDVLDEIERIMILVRDGSGAGSDRVVLKSFEHSAGSLEKRTVGDTSVVTTGMGNITISVDADSFDVMAQQIEEFKKSEYFSNVTVGTTDRDDFGRIIFTLSMSVKGFDRSPYEMYGSVQNSEAISPPVVEDLDLENEVVDLEEEIVDEAQQQELQVDTQGMDETAGENIDS